MFDDTDISRTVGWFTTLYPVRLELPKSEDIGDQLRYVRESLRHIPNKGFGYGILKYLTDKEYTKELKFDLSPQILFNYLGDFDQTRNSLFGSAEEFTQNTVHPEFEREHDLAVEGMISREKTAIFHSIFSKTVSQRADRKSVEDLCRSA
ncbi:MAG: hypothetical protein HC887_07255 [Desulfobacteraceae bacterium]|nr:hypothetical protein [Desulfobacteraceae bacterium]